MRSHRRSEVRQNSSKVLPEGAAMRWIFLPISMCSAVMTGCVTSSPPGAAHAGCGGVSGSALWARTELYFGMGKPDNTFTTNDEYQHFIDEQVSPRFRDGFTVFEGRGQYLDPKGRMWREPTKVLVLMYPPDASKSTAIDQIRNAYKTEFRQEAVLRVDGTTCVAF
jgi:hypothetical protein